MDMTKEEALAVFNQLNAEMDRSTATLHHQRIDAALEHSIRRQKLMDGLAQNGITWEDLKAAYDEEFERGHQAMLDFRLSFFYAGAAIALHEIYDQSPEQVADLIYTVVDIAAEEPDREEMLKRALDETGLDATVYSQPDPVVNPGRSVLPVYSRASRKDIAAINRMKESGITEKDLAYEHDVGYMNGWQAGFDYSACYAALAIALKQRFGTDVEQIEGVIDRVKEIADEEISAEDVLERAKVEAGVDVSGLAKHK